jgi:PhoU domain
MQINEKGHSRLGNGPCISFRSDVAVQHRPDSHQAAIEMLALDEQALTRAFDALAKCDRQSAYSVILRDQDAGALDALLDRFCLEFIVRHQPAADHLRFVYSASSSTSVGRFVLAGTDPESGARAQYSKLCCSFGIRPAGEMRRPATACMSFLTIRRSRRFRDTKRCA